MVNPDANFNLYNEGCFSPGKVVPVPMIQDSPVLFSKIGEIKQKCLKEARMRANGIE